MGSKKLLSRAIEHPRRWLVVIIGTFLLGLGTILPLADEYREQTDRSGLLRADLRQAEAEAAMLGRFEIRVEQGRVELARLEEKTISEERVNEFRGLVIEIVRDSGCQFRRIHVGASRSRPWLKNDNPLNKQTNSTKTQRTPYTLKSQSFVLDVTGTVSRLTDLLTKLHAKLNLAHTNGVLIRPVGQEGHEVQMQLELTLFDLTRLKKPRPI